LALTAIAHSRMLLVSCMAMNAVQTRNGRARFLLCSGTSPRPCRDLQHAILNSSGSIRFVPRARVLSLVVASTPTMRRAAPRRESPFSIPLALESWCAFSSQDSRLVDWECVESLSITMSTLRLSRTRATRATRSRLSHARFPRRKALAKASGWSCCFPQTCRSTLTVVQQISVPVQRTCWSRLAARA